MASRRLNVFLALFPFVFLAFYFVQRSNRFGFSPEVSLYLSTRNQSTITRAIIVFYSSTQETHYLPEFRWLFRSWIEMMKHESKAWRTDLIVFTDQYSLSLQELGCVLNEIRRNSTGPPKCRAFLYVRLAQRTINPLTQKQKNIHEQSNPEWFQIDTDRSKKLFESFRNYEYIDSVNIVAEGYPIFGDYDFILKTDIDVFITTQFGKYVPQRGTSLLYGLGGYSTNFNTRRLGRIARDLSWNYKNLTNIGSTWYGSPIVAQRVANFSLDAMIYLHANEFTPAESERKLGILLWPDWHYGVMTMYGTHLAINHLVGSNGFHIQLGNRYLDQATTNRNQEDLERNGRIHLHCWHSEEDFSKFLFKANRYDNLNPQSFVNDRSAYGYAMRIALESRRMSLRQLAEQLEIAASNRQQSADEDRTH